MKIRHLAPAALLLLILGCGRGGEQAAEEAPEAVRALPVAVQTVQPSRFVVVVEPGGSTEAWREVDLAAEVAGTVLERPHELGDLVAENALLLRVDDRLYRAQVEQAEAGLLAAEAALKQARRELERSRSLKEKGRISDAEFEGVQLGALQAESGERAARAALDLARMQLEDCEIRAPFAGRLAYIGPEKGEQLAPGMPVASLVDLSSVLIRSSLSERDVVRVSPGMTVDVFVPALADQRFEGRVSAVGPRSDPATRSFPVEIRIPNAEGRLLSGMAARSSIRVEDREGSLVIPAGAVVEQYGEPIVFTVEENLARRRPVKLGLRSDDRVEVLEGLSAGDRLVVQGQWTIKDGSAVEIRE